MTTPLGSVTGIGPRTLEYLEARGIMSVEDLLRAGVAALMEAPGFGERRANTVLDAAKDALGGVSIQPVKVPKQDKDKKKKKGKKKDNKAAKDKKRAKQGKKSDKAKEKKKDKKKDKKSGKDKKAGKKKK